jgi:hypothetical protein
MAVFAARPESPLLMALIKKTSWWLQRPGNCLRGCINILARISAGFRKGLKKTRGEGVSSTKNRKLEKESRQMRKYLLISET